MESVRSFIERFRFQSSPEWELKKALAAVLKEVFGTEVPLRAIKVRGETVRVETSPTLKSEVFLHQQQLLAMLNRKFGRYQIKKII